MAISFQNLLARTKELGAFIFNKKIHTPFLESLSDNKKKETHSKKALDDKQGEATGEDRNMPFGKSILHSAKASEALDLFQRIIPTTNPTLDNLEELQKLLEYTSKRHPKPLRLEEDLEFFNNIEFLIKIQAIKDDLQKLDGDSPIEAINRTVMEYISQSSLQAKFIEKRTRDALSSEGIGSQELKKALREAIMDIKIAVQMSSLYEDFRSDDLNFPGGSHEDIFMPRGPTGTRTKRK